MIDSAKGQCIYRFRKRRVNSRVIVRLNHSKESALQNDSPDVSLTDFQAKIRDMYYEKDLQRGIDGTFMWLIEEVGELATAVATKAHIKKSVKSSLT